MAYPDPIQSSGALSISTIRNWMIAAGELAGGTTTISLQQLVAASHLTDKTAPYSISDFYGYSNPVPGPLPYTVGPIQTIAGFPGATCADVTNTPMLCTSNTPTIVVGSIIRGDRSYAPLNEERILTDTNNLITLKKTADYPSQNVYMYEVTALASCLTDYYFQNNNYYDASPRHLHLSVYNVTSQTVTSALVLTFRIQNQAGSQYLDRTVNVALGATNGLADYDMVGTVLDGITSVYITLVSISPASDSTYIYHA